MKLWRYGWRRLVRQDVSNGPWHSAEHCLAWGTTVRVGRCVHAVQHGREDVVKVVSGDGAILVYQAFRQGAHECIAPANLPQTP